MKYIIALLLLLPICLNAQIITTVAGSGPVGADSGSYSEDGGPATDATLNIPASVVADSFGNLYIADKYNNRIRKVSSEGIITTIAGTGMAGFSGDSGPATSASLNQPNGVAIDRNRNIYIVDNYRIRKINTAGIISTIAGGSGTGYAGDGGPATAAFLSEPYAVAIDTSGNIYISDNYENVVRKINTLGIISTVVGNPYVLGYSGDGGPASAAKIYLPCGLATDNNGNLFIADNNNNVIRKIDARGIITTVAGNGSGTYSGDGGPATAASIELPTGISLDGNGNLYIVTPFNGRVRKIDYSGIISTFVGRYTDTLGDGGPATAAGLNNPTICTFDTSGNMYIADGVDNRIRKVTAALSPIHGAAAICNGSSVLLSDDTTGGSWSSVNPSAMTVNTTGTVSALLPGTDTIVYSSGINSVIHVISVNPLPELLGSAILSDICDSSAITYIPLISLPATTFSWSRATVPGIANPPATGVGTISEILYDTVATPVAVTYSFTLSAGGCTDTAIVTDTVMPTPALSSTRTPSTICDTEVFNYNPTSLTSGTAFSWSRSAVAGISNPAASGMGNPEEMLVNITDTPITVTYTYTLTANGCIHAENVSITVDPCAPIAVKNISAAIEKISISPNPASTVLTVSASIPILNLDITNLSGQTVLSQKCNGLHMQIDISALPSAVYLIKADGIARNIFIKQ